MLDTWKEAIEDFLRGIHCTRAAQTERFYKCQLTQLQHWAETQALALPDFRARHWRHYQAYRSDLVSEQTRIHDYRAAKVFFQFAQRNEYLPTTVDVFSDYEPPKRRLANIRKPTADDLLRLLRAIENRADVRENKGARYVGLNIRSFIRDRDYALVSAIIETGARITERLHVEMKDVDVEKMQIHLRVTKSKRSRYVPITPSLLPAMKPYLRRREKIQKESDAELARGNASTCNAYFFLSIVGGMMSYSAFARAFRGYLEYAGLEKFTRHGIRHYTLHEVAKVNVRSAQQLAGHTSIETTHKVLSTRRCRCRPFRSCYRFPARSDHWRGSAG